MFSCLKVIPRILNYPVMIRFHPFFILTIYQTLKDPSQCLPCPVSSPVDPTLIGLNLSDPIAQCPFSPAQTKPFKTKYQSIIASLISIQTNLYQTERSLFKSWRDRSKTQSGFDVASVTASIALGKLQSANIMTIILGNLPQ